MNHRAKVALQSHSTAAPCPSCGRRGDPHAKNCRAKLLEFSRLGVIARLKRAQRGSQDLQSVAAAWFRSRVPE